MGEKKSGKKNWNPSINQIEKDLLEYGISKKRVEEMTAEEKQELWANTQK